MSLQVISMILASTIGSVLMLLLAIIGFFLKSMFSELKELRSTQTDCLLKIQTLVDCKEATSLRLSNIEEKIKQYDENIKNFYIQFQGVFDILIEYKEELMLLINNHDQIIKSIQ